MFTISKEFHCSSSHVLNGLGQSHPCGKVHGHNYVIRVFLRSEKLNDVGFVRDYRALGIIKEFIDENLDHTNLNELIYQPTAEIIAKMIYDRFKDPIPELFAVEISETPKTNARYEP